MREIFVTGGTGYVGSYVLHQLLRKTDRTIRLLVRAHSERQALEKLWRNMQLHLSPDAFWERRDRIRFAFGDLHAPGLGLSEREHAHVVNHTESVLHIAASLNRRSEKSCVNSNLRGTLSVIRLAREIHTAGGLRRFSHVSTVAVAGERQDETVTEDGAIDWNRSDYDPYARTKKFAEHMIAELLADVPLTFFRPSIVMGDSRFSETTQFDMVRAMCLLADLPVIPMNGKSRIDTVNPDFVGDAVAAIHLMDNPRYEVYHLSSGEGSCSAAQIAAACVGARDRAAELNALRFFERGSDPFFDLVTAMGSAMLPAQVRRTAALLKAFWPYLTFNTVFHNGRIIEEMGRGPVSFVNVARDLYRYAKNVGFQYNHKPLPDRPVTVTTGQPQVRA